MADDALLKHAFMKVEDTKKLYVLLKVICIGNDANQMLVWDFYQQILYQCQYLKEAADLIVLIVKENHKILQQLSVEIKTSFNSAGNFFI